MPADSLPIEQRVRYEEMMLEQAQHMQAIVSDLLTLSTLESSPSAETAAVPLNCVIEQALHRVQALSNGQHVFVTNIDDNLWLEGPRRAGLGGRQSTDQCRALHAQRRHHYHLLVYERRRLCYLFGARHRDWHCSSRHSTFD